MYLILVMARTISPAALKKRSAKKLPEHDLKPVMIAINRSEPEYFVREHDSRRYGTRQDDSYADIPRVFCRLSECDGAAVKNGDPEDAVASGRSQMAVVLATVVVPPDATEPESDDFASYVADRSRLADRIVVAGYTDDSLSMRKSEILGLERARAVKRILVQNKIKAPITAIARPKCNYSRIKKLSHRVEVTALFFGAPEQEKIGDSAAASEKKGKRGRNEKIGISKREVVDE